MLSACLHWPEAQFSPRGAKESLPSLCAFADVSRPGRGPGLNAGAYLAGRVTGEAKHVLPSGTHRGTVLPRPGAHRREFLELRK